MVNMTTLCYIQRDNKYLMLHRTTKKSDLNRDKWLGVGGHFEPEESPEDCLLREVREETGYTLTDWKYRALVTFVSGTGETEYMSLFTADGFTGAPAPCSEGELKWVDRDEVLKLNIWEGDKIFFRLLREREDFFSLKLVYGGGDRLAGAVLNGRPMELLDVLDETGAPTGIVRERGVVHRDGSPHAAAHIWVVRQRPDGGWDLLLQKRSPNKDSYPGCYDISAAGHVSAGDDTFTTALRELQEELGITAAPEQLHYIGLHQGYHQSDFHGAPFRDREFSSVYVYREPVDIDRLELQAEEVESVRWMDFKTCRQAVARDEIPNCLYPDELALLGRYLQGERQQGCPPVSTSFQKEGRP